MNVQIRHLLFLLILTGNAFGNWHTDHVCGNLWRRLVYDIIPVMRQANGAAVRDYGSPLAQKQVDRKGGIAAIKKWLGQLEERGASKEFDASKPVPNVTYGLNQYILGMPADSSFEKAAGRMKSVLGRLRPQDAVLHLKGPDAVELLQKLNDYEKPFGSLRQVDGEVTSKSPLSLSSLSNDLYVGAVLAYLHQASQTNEKVAKWVPPALGAYWGLITLGQTLHHASEKNQHKFDAIPHIEAMLSLAKEGKGNNKKIYLGIENQEEEKYSVDFLFNNAIQPELTVVLRKNSEPMTIKEHRGEKRDSLIYKFQEEVRALQSRIYSDKSLSNSKRQELINRRDRVLNTLFTLEAQKEEEKEPEDEFLLSPSID
jgi:hypothetical protein